MSKISFLLATSTVIPGHKSFQWLQPYLQGMQLRDSSLGFTGDPMWSFTSASKAWALYHIHPVANCMEHK